MSLIKCLGILCVLGGGALLGVGESRKLLKRVECLRGLISALQQMERELSFRLSSTPQLMTLLAQSAPPPVNILFANCKKGLGQLGERGFQEIWTTALDSSELQMEKEGRETLASLGTLLGRYDRDQQKQGLSQIISELEGQLTQAETQWRRLGRVYTTLGVGGGALLVLVLL